MRKLILTYVAIAAFFGVLGESLLSGHTKWQQYVSYNINVNFYPENHRLIGSALIQYQNNSPDTLQQIYLHLYPNAFRPGSIMDKEAKRSSIILIHNEEEIGWMRLRLVSIKKHGSQNGENLKKIDYNEDSTVVCFYLKEPLFSGDKLDLSMKFEVKIRKFNYQYDKSGYSGDLFEISQWYPKVCVYDDNGWNADAHHFLGEFYGEFGRFEVTISAPEEFVIAATGEVVSGDPGWESVAVRDEKQRCANELEFDIESDNGGSRRKVKFLAEHVHDFVWTASSNYVFETDTVLSVPVLVLYEKSAEKTWAKNALIAARHALEWLNQNIGEYPYPQLTLAQGLTDGGMEYPMVTVLGYYDFFLVFHEICHMYFYAAVANNEQLDAWLDEGLVTYLAALFKKEKYPGNSYKIAPSLRYPFSKEKFAKYGDYEKIKLNSLYYYLFSEFDRPMHSLSYRTKDYFIYNYHAYVKPEQFFALLDYIVGREDFLRIIQTYYQTWKFKHVDAASLKEACEMVTDKNLDEFFHCWIYEIPKVDFAVKSLRSVKKKGMWQTEIEVENHGNCILPVEIQLVSDKKDTVIYRVENPGEDNPIIFTTNNKVVQVKLDPQDLILDQNRLNNGVFDWEWFLYPSFPSMYYQPRDAYSVFYFPQLWYNDIDGLEIGMQFLGGYLNRYYITRSKIWYNVSSQKIDFQFAYSMPWERLGRNFWRHFQIQQIDGKRTLSANIQYNYYRRLFAHPNLSCRLGFEHFKLIDVAYNSDEIRVDGQYISRIRWQPGDLNKIFFHLKLRYWKKFPNLSLELKSGIADKLWGSDFNYHKLFLLIDLKNLAWPKKLSFDWRGFMGFSSATDIPIQDKFGVSGGSSIRQFDHFYLRSPGFLQKYLNYHFPGDGNLRGYHFFVDKENHALNATKIVSSNFQVNYPLRHLFIPKKWQSHFPAIIGYLFFDGGRVWNGNSTMNLFDAGIGFKFSKKLFGKMRNWRVEFPLWLSNTDPAKLGRKEKNWKFRWMISFQ